LHPILFRIPLPWGGHFDIATYGVMMALGTIAGVIVALRLAKRDGVSSETVVDVAFWCVMGGIIGAKVWFVVQFWGEFEDKWDLVRNFRSGLVFYGGFIGGAAGVIGYAAYKHLRLFKMLDVFAAPAALGLAFGRVGCFFNGCCYGIETKTWLGVCFRRVVSGEDMTGSPAFLDQMQRGIIPATATATTPVLATQLFEATGALVIFAVMLAMRRYRKIYGEQIALIFVLYPMVRFTVEFFRGDHGPSVWGLTIAQLFSVTAFAAGAAGLAYLRLRRPRRLVIGEGD